MLSTLQTPLARKKLVKELWESGAYTIVSFPFGLFTSVISNTPELF